MKIGVSHVCQAFADVAIGSKVINRTLFMSMLEAAVPKATFRKGIARIDLECLDAVSCGVARHTDVLNQNKDDPIGGYVVRWWRESPHVFALRKHAAKVVSLSVILYAIDEYRANPNGIGFGEGVTLQDCTHVIVAVLAEGNKLAPLSSHRFVRNLGGGNNIYTAAAGYTLDDVVKEAQAIVAYERDWIVVAD